MSCELTYAGLKKCVINDYPFTVEWNDDQVYGIFRKCYNVLIEEHSHINNSYYSDNNGGKLKLEYLDHYIILCFRFSNELKKNNMINMAEAVYYSLRVRGAVDIFYTSEIGRCFMPVHAMGTVMDSHAKYGEFFKIYDGCHIGPYSIVGKEPKDWEHPRFGDYVTMLAHSKVYGNSKIGNNVIIATETLIINEDIPDNCIVSGNSPHLFFQKLRVSNSSILK